MEREQQNKVDQFLYLVAEINMKIAVTSLIVLIVINAVEITIRFVADMSMIWIQDISVLLVVWMIFCGTTKTVFEKKDIVIRMFVDRIKGRARVIVDIIAHLSVLIFLVVYSVFGYKLIQTQLGTFTLTAEIPMIYYTLPVPIMGISCTLIYLHEIYQCIVKLCGIKEV